MKNLDKFFKVTESGSTIGTEITGGLTTFFAMVYIIFVNPSILAESGMNWSAVFMATILASVIGTLIMGLYANVPYAQSAGMGLNAFFTYVVCGALGFTWQEALCLVFICGMINIFITVTNVRKQIIASIPEYLQNAIGGAIGLFIAYIGLKNGGFLKFTIDPGNYEQFGEGGTIVAPGFAPVPELSALNDAVVLVAIFGLIVTVILMILKVKGAMFIGIVAGVVAGMIAGSISFAGVNFFDMSAVSSLKETFGVIFTKAGFPSLFGDPSRLFLAFATIFAFSLSDTFDTIGTFIGTGKVSGIFDEKDLASIGEKGGNTKIEKALVSDAVATSMASILGSSNVTTFVESAAGIGAGARTGLASVVVAVMFLLCIPFSGVVGVLPGEVTAPALIVVGILMSSSFKDIKWDDIHEAIPAFMTIIITTLAYNISYGIAAGFIFHCLIKIAKGQVKDLHPILIVSTVLFVLNFIVLAGI